MPHIQMKLKQNKLILGHKDQELDDNAVFVWIQEIFYRASDEIVSR